MRVCSICGERNEDWMEICQRCGNSIANAKQVENETQRRNLEPMINNMNNNTQSYEEKKPIMNLDLKITLGVLLIILICLAMYAFNII